MKGNITIEGQKSPKQFDPSKYAKNGLSETDVIKIKECFDIFDTNKQGTITPNDLKTAIFSLGIETQAQKVLEIIDDSVGTNKQVNFESFLDIFKLNSDITDQKVLQELFQQFDSQGKGKITFEDFKKVSQSIGERYSDQELKEMVEFADKNKDGSIDLKEFLQVVYSDNPGH